MLCTATVRPWWNHRTNHCDIFPPSHFRLLTNGFSMEEILKATATTTESAARKDSPRIGRKVRSPPTKPTRRTSISPRKRPSVAELWDVSPNFDRMLVLKPPIQSLHVPARSCSRNSLTNFLTCCEELQTVPATDLLFDRIICPETPAIQYLKVPA